MKKLISIQNEGLKLHSKPLIIPKFPIQVLSEKQSSKFDIENFKEIKERFEQWCEDNTEASVENKLQQFAQLLVDNLDLEVRTFKVFKNNEYKIQNWFDPIFPKTKESQERIKEIERNINTYYQNPNLPYIDFATFIKESYNNLKPADQLLASAISQFEQNYKHSFLVYHSALDQQDIINLEPIHKDMLIYGKENVDNIRYFPIYYHDKLMGIMELKQWLKPGHKKMDTKEDIAQFESLFEQLTQKLEQGCFFDKMHCLDPNSSDVKYYPYKYDKNLMIEEINNPAHRCPELKSSIIKLMRDVLKGLNQDFPDIALEDYFNCSKLIIIRDKNSAVPCGFIAVDYLKNISSRPFYFSGVFLNPSIQFKNISSYFAFRELGEELDKRSEKISQIANPLKIRFYYLFRSHNPSAVSASIRFIKTYPNIKLFKQFTPIMREEIKRYCDLILKEPSDFSQKYIQLLKILVEDGFVLYKKEVLKKKFENDKQFISFLNNHLKDLTFNLRNIRQFEDRIYQEDGERYNPFLRPLYQKLRDHVDKNTPAIYKEIAKEKARTILGDNVNNIEYYDPVFFIQKEVSRLRVPNYNQVNLNNKKRYLTDITHFVHGLVHYKENNKKLDVVIWVGGFKPIDHFKEISVNYKKRNKKKFQSG